MNAEFYSDPDEFVKLIKDIETNNDNITTQISGPPDKLEIDHYQGCGKRISHHSQDTINVCEFCQTFRAQILLSPYKELCSLTTNNDFNNANTNAISQNWINRLTTRIHTNKKNKKSVLHFGDGYSCSISHHDFKYINNCKICQSPKVQNILAKSNLCDQVQWVNNVATDIYFCGSNMSQVKFCITHIDKDHIISSHYENCISKCKICQTEKAQLIVGIATPFHIDNHVSLELQTWLNNLTLELRMDPDDANKYAIRHKDNSRTISTHDEQYIDNCKLCQTLKSDLIVSFANPNDINKNINHNLNLELYAWLNNLTLRLNQSSRNLNKYFICHVDKHDTISEHSEQHINNCKLCQTPKAQVILSPCLSD